ncbi:hypothetical protein DFH28DRAFT_949304 [Melampsora americana]|nr:hypothetical protein DFH28DRAFT_949304 [Melampsora americana]
MFFFINLSFVLSNFDFFFFFFFFFKPFFHNPLTFFQLFKHMVFFLQFCLMINCCCC